MRHSICITFVISKGFTGLESSAAPVSFKRCIIKLLEPGTYLSRLLYMFLVREHKGTKLVTQVPGMGQIPDNCDDCHRGPVE